mgnify:CR=1 FL=1
MENFGPFMDQEARPKAIEKLERNKRKKEEKGRKKGKKA